MGDMKPGCIIENIANTQKWVQISFIYLYLIYFHSLVSFVLVLDYLNQQLLARCNFIFINVASLSEVEMLCI